MPLESRSWILLAVSWPLCTLSTLLVTLRILVRTHLLRSFGWDDTSILLALLCSILNTILVTISAHHGTGQHTAGLSPYQVTQSTKYNWLSQGFHVMSTNWGKVSVGLFLLRIIQKVKSRRHKPVMYAGLVIMTLINAVCVYTIYGQCAPTSRLWDQTIEGECWDPEVQRDYAFFQGSASAFSDLVLAVYPLFTIYHLQMPLRLKIGLGILLSLGIIAMTAAIIKTINLSCLTSRSDYPWDTVNLVIWIAIEQYLIIIAACIPTLTPLVNIVVSGRWRDCCSKGNGNTGSSNANLASPGTPTTKHFFSPYTSAQAEEAMYPLSWARTSEEDPVAVARDGRGILMTTEICVRSEYGEPGPPEDQTRLI
ncbi:hypothetical protein BJX66DRAFT_353367 [Aspergillus keveii]|uniref:Rhodopsin domain-containing protein n=1 Tax=Aspergillus keveii TaxID=714993 RepID=A0ABR4FVV9_9EURO